MCSNPTRHSPARQRMSIKSGCGLLIGQENGTEYQLVSITSELFVKLPWEFCTSCKISWCNITRTQNQQFYMVSQKNARFSVHVTFAFYDEWCTKSVYIQLLYEPSYLTFQNSFIICEARLDELFYVLCDVLFLYHCSNDVCIFVHRDWLVCVN